MDIQNEPVMRGVLLSFIYSKRRSKYAKVRPDSFSPPWAMHDILYYGREFHEAGLIEGCPSNDGDGYFMRISPLGKSVWEGDVTSPLATEGLPD